MMAEDHISVSVVEALPEWYPDFTLRQRRKTTGHAEKGRMNLVSWK